MKKCATRVAFIGAIVLCSGMAASAPLGGGDFAVTRFTVDGGGGTSSDGPYLLSGSIGQPDAGQMAGGAYALSGGFFSGQVNSPPSCPGDTDGSGAVDIDDIINVVLDFGSDGSGHNGDADGSGVVDIDDVIFVVLNFGNTCPGT
jgi:hypothetical protein